MTPDPIRHGRTGRIHWTLPLVLAWTAAVPAAVADDGGDDHDACHGDENACEQTARLLREASQLGAREDYQLSLADCLRFEDREESRECLREARAAYREALDLVGEQYEARRDLCEALDEGRYDPEIDPADFAAPLHNPFFPLTPGLTRVYESETEEGLEHVETTVTADTREILGISCTVVHDVATLDGEIIEDTYDYYAADRRGNVWYFGELAMNYEDGFLHDLDGSWIGGEDGARPGILMAAERFPGLVYRQEFQANEAEDAARITGLDRTVDTPFGTFPSCLETFDFSPLEPELREAKFYAPGIGPVLEVNLETGERLELIAVL